jgi:hypothetical protein
VSESGRSPSAPAGAALYRRVRSALILQGRTLEGIARDLGVDRRNLAHAITGRWTGPRASELRAAACRAARIEAHQ